MASDTQTLSQAIEPENITANDTVYEDQKIGAELTRKDINRVAWRSMLLQASFNYERMQACGWLYGLLPALKKSIPINGISPVRCRGIWGSSIPILSWSPL